MRVCDGERCTCGLAEARQGGTTAVKDNQMSLIVMSLIGRNRGRARNRYLYWLKNDA